ncbi:hypothetical protein [Nocardia sp. NPDC057353]|uniref:hypothetical protein n=1 Tax=Nocardia sp. NPDC057353 TaxID=3346104 RepID=UPI0036280F3A
MRPINSKAYHRPFVELPWPDIAARYRELAAQRPAIQHMSDIIESVLACGADRQLAGVAIMDGLAVAARPLPEPPVAEIVVLTSGRDVRSGTVVIEHRSISGHDDRIARPVAEAVPLFWRFVIEKFGIVPDRPG